MITEFNYKWLNFIGTCEGRNMYTGTFMCEGVDIKLNFHLSL